MNKKACIDIDGVLADFEGAFCEKFGWESRHLVRFEDRYPDRADEIEAFVSSSKTYERLDILHLGVQIVKFLKHRGFDIHMVSSRPEYCSQVTGLWLKRNKIPFHFLSVGIFNKFGYYANQNPALVVEDMYDVAANCASFGISTFLIDQPWNFSVNSWNIRRIKTFEKFLADFEQISETLMGF